MLRSVLTRPVALTGLSRQIKATAAKRTLLPLSTGIYRSQGAFCRCYATHKDTQAPPPPPPPFSSKPSIGERVWNRISRASTFLFSSALVAAAVGLTGLVLYVAVEEVFMPSGDTQVFNRTVKLLENDQKCQELLGGNKFKAYGESTDNRWARSRPIASKRYLGQDKKEHLVMRFHVEGSERTGLAQLEMVPGPDGKLVYVYLRLDVPEFPPHYLVKPAVPGRPKKERTGFLGVRWGPKKDAN